MTINIGKLNTKHDKFNIHKILGSISLFHFFVNFCYPQKWNTLNIGIRSIFTLTHLILGLSSLIFKVPLKRSNIYLIYEQLRLHNILFTLRSILMWFSIAYEFDYKLFRISLIFLTMIGADIIVKMYPSGGTLIHRHGYSGNQSLLQKYSAYILSFAQIVGTYSMLFSNDLNTQINQIMVIQFGAFFATLTRKGVISSSCAAILYGTIATVAVLKTAYTYGIAYIIIPPLIFYTLRCLSRNPYYKYLLWSIFTIIYHLII